MTLNQGQGQVDKYQNVEYNGIYQAQQIKCESFVSYSKYYTANITTIKTDID